MKKLLETMTLPLSDLIKDCYHFIAGIVVTVFGYFSPVKDIVNFLLFLFLLDMIIGIWHSRKIKKEPFHPKWIWDKTVPRAFMTLVIISCLYLWDTIYGQNAIHTYNLVGWFVSGMLIWSILDNGYRITKWKPFQIVERLIGKEVKNKTGYQIKDTEEDSI